MTADGPAALAQRLSDGGHLPAAWLGSFTRVDRAGFLPDRIWARVADGYEPVDRYAEPDRWRKLAYSDEALVTQVEDRPGAAVARTPSSSASMPSVVATMLQALDVHDGQRVLEIGAGTGYNAALLSARLGSEQVTTVEVDPALADRARAALESAGHRPAVITADGTDGWPPGAPYDRTIATCAVHDVPRAWIEQTAPGGLIVLPWGTALRNGVLLRLTVEDRPDGPVASGPVVGDSAFMWLRAQEPDRNVMAVVRGGADSGGTRLDPSFLGDDDAWFAAGVLVPGCRSAAGSGPDGAWTLWLADSASGSWASVDYEPDATDYEVRQHGPRLLWNELEAAHAWWERSGRPARTRFGLTVTPTGQRVWLDCPDNVIPADLRREGEQPAPDIGLPAVGSWNGS
ncbi:MULTISPECIES: methyltransferase domain-containing protein [Streptomyces]|uniref:Protein-L-isoaspartate O-methyltransferase n=1 Tax=Streptomyces lonegramiae TaxID=3075524 RepID=A0ABU2X8D8_9ACTN|nr:methyltransferase domain-containing protein [Streptomyces sp. DSM 41529]MDT0542195.1 methyltransferase domain-containing protein [Streptomyces sp. DSM 41529]